MDAPNANRVQIPPQKRIVIIPHLIIHVKLGFVK
jgi:hypothetical protein